MNKEIVEYICIAIILIVVVGLCLLYYIGYTIEKMRKIAKPLQKNKKNNVNFKIPIINEEILCKIYNQEKII